MEASFTTSADGTHIAWSRHGSGPALVRVGTWLTHLDYDWSSPLWRHWLSELGDRFTVVRYDDRGSGLSDRDPAEYSLDAWRADLEAVVDAAQLGTFTLLGMSQGGAVAVDYARTHSERVENLVLYGAYARGATARAVTEEQRAERAARAADRGRVGPRRLGLPPGLHLDLHPRRIGGPAALVRRAAAAVHVAGGRTCQLPCAGRPRRQRRGGGGHLPDPRPARRRGPGRALRAGRLLAGLIPGARFVPLHSANHILLADEPAWPQFLTEVTAFVGGGAPSGPAAVLTGRELELLRLVARGRNNVEIGTELSLSPRTVERHLSNIYAKLALTGKSARAAAAAQLPDLERRSSLT